VQIIFSIKQNGILKTVNQFKISCESWKNKTEKIMVTVLWHPEIGNCVERNISEFCADTTTYYVDRKI
jgi:gamma-glutamyl-gamma-aminobutyrate hydrolase PuuD